MIKYCCDRCKKEVKSGTDLYPVSIMDHIRDMSTWASASICKECVNDLALFLGNGEPRSYSFSDEFNETVALNKINDLLDSRWELGSYITLQRIKEIIKNLEENNNESNNISST